MMFFKLSIISTIIYVLSMTFTKLSVLCLYIRVLSYARVRLAAKIMLAVVLVSHAFILATLATACVPFDAFWDFEKRKTAYCHPSSVYWTHAGLNIVTDFLIFTLPLTVISKIRTSRPEKICLVVVFLLAFSVCIISLVRAVLLAVAIKADRGDVLWYAASTANWNTSEINIAIICACLTTMKPIVVRFFPGLSASPYGSTLSDEEDISGARGPQNRPRYSETELYAVAFSSDAAVGARRHKTREAEEAR
ncbi:hypothetical protein QBC43DRAFT_320571 [Cladorrhinum sp. PSN259]|nr:hypothetical protein QBC43DRAFT_320571 [Cladorrhinum sp. PSN259]